MEVHLRPDQQTYIEDRIQAGRFASVDDAVEEAIGLLTERDTELPAVAENISLGDLLLRSPLYQSGIVVKRAQDAPETDLFG